MENKFDRLNNYSTKSFNFTSILYYEIVYPYFFIVHAVFLFK
jgi:hypothetical protein